MEAVEKISVVVPVYNEIDVLPEFHRRLTEVLQQLDMRREVVYVNDGSTDASLALIENLHRTDRAVAVLDLSRNYGKEIAVTAGLDTADGDAVVVIDADLQDPPELIPELVRHWRAGFDVVYAKRDAREGESALKRSTAYLFYRVMQSVSRVKIPEDTGDYRLLSRRAVETLRAFREHHRFMKGLFTWIGYPQHAVAYHRDRRLAGKTKWGYWKLWNLALEGITSFTTAPLRISTYVGLTTAFAAFAYGTFIVIRTLIFGNPVAGYSSLITIMLFLGGVQLTAIGVLGEYVGRIFNETKHRPLYIVNKYERSADVLVTLRPAHPDEVAYPVAPTGTG